MGLRLQKGTIMSKLIEYKVRPIARFVVTRFEQEDDGQGTAAAGRSQMLGEYESHDTAYEVAYALAKTEYDKYPAEHFFFPERLIPRGSQWPRPEVAA